MRKYSWSYLNGVANYKFLKGCVINEFVRRCIMY